MKNKKDNGWFYNSIFVAVAIGMVILLTGCSSKAGYPSVWVRHGVWVAASEIDIGYPYEYDGFDTSDTDIGKDVIVHFKKGDGK